MNPSRREFVAAAVAAAAASQFAAASSTFGAAPAAPPVFLAGAAVADITSPPEVNVDGVIARSGPGKGAHDRMHARTLALDDGTTRLTLTICDVRMIGRRVCDEAKRIASAATKIPVEHMLVAATHTHGTPTPIDLFDDEPYVKWQQLVIERVAASIVEAVANLVPAKLGRASTRKPDYTFNRRWKLKDGATMPPNPFGGTDDKVLTNPGSRRDQLLEPAGPVDDELTVVSVRRVSDDGPLAVLANYSTHYVGGYAGALVSSDYYGVFGERVKELLAPGAAGAAGRSRPDAGSHGGAGTASASGAGATGTGAGGASAGGPPPFVAMMFNGTSGDVNTIDFAGEPDRSPPWERIAKVGDDMAKTAVGLIDGIEHRSDVRLAAAVKEIELGVRKPDAARVAWAEALQADPKRNRGWPMMYAREALAMRAYPDRVKLLVQAMRIGEFAVAAMPCEVFAATGLQIKQRSPVQPTINIGLANGYHGYLPTPEQHALGGYETWLARTSYLEVDASEQIRDAALEVLARVK